MDANAIMKTPIKNDACVDSLKLLGDYWTLRIIDSLESNELRYCELQRTVGNVNPVTFTAKLKKLEEAQIVDRTEESLDKISVTYRLTKLGQSVLPVIKAMNNFAEKLAASV